LKKTDAKSVKEFWREFMSKRVMSVAGSFYPFSCSEVERYFKNFEKIVSLEKKDAKAIIVPHAGYIYSGWTASLAYRSVNISNKKRVVVIGPSHRVYLEGVSISLFDEYETPCGALRIDSEYAKKLFNGYTFASFFPDAHKEHSTETQMPFVKKYFDGVEVVEIVYGRIDFKLLAFMVEEIVKDEENLLVISTDLSHFYDLQKAKQLDSICLNAIVKKDLKLFDKGCEACGIVGVKALISVAKKKSLNVEFLDYRTSYDVTKDDKSVVGYSSFLLF
jgi:AmmeMemoRadiSam system protein B